jgi:hypothetical protein
VFVHKTENIIDPGTKREAVLSHSSPKQVKDFTATEFDAFNQVHDHPHVRQHRRLRQTRLVEHHTFQLQFDWWRIGGWRRLWIGNRSRACQALLPATIETLLQTPSLVRSTVCSSPLIGTLSAMVPPTTKRTAQIPPTVVPGMREEANPALLAVNGAVLKLRMSLQNRVQRRLILPDNRLGAVVLVPIRAKREKPLDGYGKKARFSVTMLSVVFTPSSYLLDANASRGRARFFVRAGQQFARTVRTNDPLHMARPNYRACGTDATSLRVKVRCTT